MVCSCLFLGYVKFFWCMRKDEPSAKLVSIFFIFLRELFQKDIWWWDRDFFWVSRAFWVFPVNEKMKFEWTTKCPKGKVIVKKKWKRCTVHYLIWTIMRIGGDSCFEHFIVMLIHKPNWKCRKKSPDLTCSVSNWTAKTGFQDQKNQSPLTLLSKTLNLSPTYNKIWVKKYFQGI